MTEPDANAPPAPAPADAVKTPEPSLTRSPKPPEPSGDPLFDALWEKVLGAWDDDKVHGAVLEYSVGAERLPDLAGRYRALVDDAEKGPRSKKRLDAIVVAATQMMMSMKTSASSRVPLPIMLTVVGLCACAVLFVAYAMTHR